MGHLKRNFSQGFYNVDILGSHELKGAKKYLLFFALILCLAGFVVLSMPGLQKYLAGYSQRELALLEGMNETGIAILTISVLFLPFVIFFIRKIILTKVPKPRDYDEDDDLGHFNKKKIPVQVREDDESGYFRRKASANQTTVNTYDEKNKEK